MFLDLRLAQAILAEVIQLNEFFDVIDQALNFVWGLVWGSLDHTDHCLCTVLSSVLFCTTILYCKLWFSCTTILYYRLLFNLRILLTLASVQLYCTSLHICRLLIGITVLRFSIVSFGSTSPLDIGFLVFVGFIVLCLGVSDPCATLGGSLFLLPLYCTEFCTVLYYDSVL